MRRYRQSVFLLLVLQLIFIPVSISTDKMHFVAIIMDDLGNDLSIGNEVIAMPYDITYSFLPHTKYSQQLIKTAHETRKEIMLHLPMQSINNRLMGPGGLNDTMPQLQFIETLKKNLHAVPWAIGINNHMGSLLTQNKIKMSWLMQELKENKNLYFVDSKTHARSVAAEFAQAYHVPTAERDIFLDNNLSADKIDLQFDRLLKRLNSVGYALAIGHPHKETIAALKRWLPKLKKAGIEIVKVSQYIALKEMRHLIWQASLSRSHKVVKN